MVLISLHQLLYFYPFLKINHVFHSLIVLHQLRDFYSFLKITQIIHHFHLLAAIPSYLHFYFYLNITLIIHFSIISSIIPLFKDLFFIFIGQAQWLFSHIFINQDLFQQPLMFSRIHLLFQFSQFFQLCSNYLMHFHSKMNNFSDFL